MLAFDEPKLASELGKLPFLHRIAFAASCCERMAPNYRAFATMEHLEGVDTLDQTLDAIWSLPVLVSHSQKSALPELILSCEHIMPNTEVYSTLFANPAFNTISAFIYTLEAYKDGDPHRVALVGRMAYDAVEIYLQKVDHPNPASYFSQTIIDALNALPRDAMVDHFINQDREFEKWILGHPIMVLEITKQRDDLLSLAMQPSLNMDFLYQLRESSRIMGIQPFHRGIVKPIDPNSSE